jgi:hypothetical protein
MNKQLGCQPEGGEGVYEIKVGKPKALLKSLEKLLLKFAKTP